MAIVIKRAGGIKLLLQAANAPAYPAPTVTPLNVDVYFHYKGDTQAPEYLGTFPVGKEVSVPLATDLDRDVIITTVARGPVGQKGEADIRDAPSLVAQSEREQRKPVIGQMGASTYLRAIIGVGYFPGLMRTRRILIASDAAFTTIIARWFQNIDKTNAETPRMSEQFSINRFAPGTAAVTYYVKVSHTAFSVNTATDATEQLKLENLRWGPDSDILTVTLADNNGAGGSSGSFNPFTATFQGYGSGVGDITFSVPMPGDLSGSITGTSNGFSDRLAIWKPDDSLTYSFPIYADRPTGRILANGYVLPSGLGVYGGAASPEGAQIAEPGSRYFQGDGTQWKKATGAGNTGWVIVATAQTLKNQGTAVPVESVINFPAYSPLRWVAGTGETILEAPGVESAVRNLVTDFGADPLGVVDIGTALAAALATKGRTHLPRGQYRLNSTFTIPNSHEYDGFSLEGHGIGSTEIVFYGTGNAFEMANGALDNAAFKNFRVVCNNVGNTGDGFHFYGDATSVNTQLNFEDVGVWNFGGYGWNFDNIQSSMMLRCHGRGSKKGHVKIFDSDDISPVKEPNSNIIWNCRFDNSTVAGTNESSIYLFHANGVIIGGQTTIQGNYAGSTGNLHAVYAENCDSLQFQGLWVENLSLGGAAVYLKGCRAAKLDGYHGSGAHPWDFEFEACRSITISGATLTNSVPHFVNNGSFDISVHGSVMSHPTNVYQSDTTGHIYIAADNHYHALTDDNYREYVGTNSLFTNWAENWVVNPNIVDDTTGWTFDAAYVSRVATGSPSGYGGYWLFDPGAIDGGAFVTGQILEQTITIPDSVVANYWTLTWDVWIESDGTANDAGRHVGFALVTTGQGEFTQQYKNQLYNVVPQGKWIRQSLAVYVKPVTSRTLRFRIDPNQTTKGPNTPRLRFANFRLTPGREATPGGQNHLTEEKTGIVRGADGMQFASRPSAAAPPAGYGAFRFNGTQHQVYEGGAWTGIASKSYAIHAVLDHGADPTGATDSTTELQAAIDAAESAGRAVYLPAGIYLTTGLTITGQVVLFGDGDKFSVIYSTTNAIIIDCSGVAFRGATISGITVRGLVTAGSAQIGLKLDDPTYMFGVRLEKSTIEKTGGIGLYTGKAYSMAVRDLYIDDCAGYPFVYDGAGMPTNIFENVYVGAIRATAPVCFMIKSGDFYGVNLNCVNTIELGSVGMVVGRQTGLYGESGNQRAFARLDTCNIEAFHTYGLDVLSSSEVSFDGRCTFARRNVNSTIGSGGIDNTQTSIPIAGNMDTLYFPASGELMVVEGANTEVMVMSSHTTNVATVTRGTPAYSFTTAAVVYSRHAIGINYRLDTGGTLPNLLSKGAISDESLVVDGPESFYAKGSFIHGNELPPLMTHGEGPAVASGAPIHNYYNTTRSRVEELVRADDFMPPQKITGSTTYANIGPRYIECSFSAPGTVTLPWTGWLRYPRPVIIFDAAGNAATNNITIAAGGGSTVNGVSSYTIDQNKGAVILMPDVATGDYRVISASNAGANRALSNLTSPAINTHLLFGTDAASDIGASAASRPRNLYIGNAIVMANGAATVGGQNWTITGGASPQYAVSDGTIQARLQLLTGSYLQFGTTSNHNTLFLHNGAGIFTLRAAGLIPETTATYQLGGDSNRWTDLWLSGLLSLKEGAAPGTPAADTVTIYAKDKAGVSALYFKNDAGTETEIATGASGANTALGNLAAVAVNVDLDPATDAARDLGNASLTWRDLFLHGLKMGTRINLSADVDQQFINGDWTGIPGSIAGKFVSLEDDIYFGADGSGVARGRFVAASTHATLCYNTFFNGSALRALDTAKPGYLLQLDQGAEEFSLHRAPATAGDQTFTKVCAFDLTTGNLKIAGNAVVGTRKTGHTAATGTAERGAYATYTAPTISVLYTQAEVQAMADHIQVLSRQLKAMKDDLISHGLLGS